jgi:acetyl esterase/lipase
MTMEPITVTYATRRADGRAWQADVYAAENVERAPVVIILPGEASDRTTPSFRDLAVALAERNCVAVIADHYPARGAQMMREGGAGFREAVENVASLVGSAGELAGVQADRVIVFGQSAGGVNGLFVALEGDGAVESWDAYRDGEIGRQTESAFAAGPFRLDGFVGLNGGYEAPYAMRSANEELAAFLTPFSRLDRPERTLRFIVGMKDELIPAPIATRHRELFSALESAGHDVVVTEVDDGHMPTTGSPGWQASLDAITTLATDMP